MTESQQGLSLLTRLAPAGSRAYAEVTTLRLRGPLEIEVLTAALQMLVDRHEGLRTTIDASGEHQIVQPHATLGVPMIDLTQVPDDERNASLTNQFAEIEWYTFDFSQAPVLTARLIRLAEAHHLLILTFHHIFGNGPSYAVFFQELCDVYAALSEGSSPQLEPAMQLSDYVGWRERQLGAPEFEQDRTFWHHQFADTMPVLDLPTDHPRPSVMTYRGGRRSLTIGALLAAIDCDLQPTRTSPSGLFALPTFLLNLPHWVREDAIHAGLKDVVGRLRSRLRRAAAAGTHVLGKGRGASGAPQVDLRDQLGMWRFPDYQLAMLELHHQAIDTFDPRPFDGKATLFLPRTSPLFGPWPRTYDPSWDQLARGGVDVHSVRGSHSTMMSDPFVADLAARLNAAIVAAEQRENRTPATGQGRKGGSVGRSRLSAIGLGV